MRTKVSYKDVNFLMSIPDEDLLHHYPGSNVQTCILNDGVWAREETEILNTILIFSKGTVVDVGANTGYFSFIALHNNCKVIAFEPNVIHTKYFKETIQINNHFSEDNVKHYELFVSSQADDILFDGWSSNNALMNHDVHTHYKVKTVALDNICDECLFLKIDVEGFEPDVIKSASRLLQNNSIKYIMFEITYILNDILDEENINMLKTIKSYGFELYEIIPNLLKKIGNVDDAANAWYQEFHNHHKKHNPAITNGGTNILAIHHSAINPFTRAGNTENCVL
jgi:FkbM family methyltransferase